MKYLVYVHGFFMAAALVLIVTAAMIAHGKKEGWFLLHRKTALTGVVSALLGGTAMISFKVLGGFPHFQSPHAIGGAATLILLIVTTVLGFLIASNPNTYRRIHRVMGQITAVAVVITGVVGIARFIQISRN